MTTNAKPNQHTRNKTPPKPPVENRVDDSYHKKLQSMERDLEAQNPGYRFQSCRYRDDGDYYSTNGLACPNYDKSNGAKVQYLNPHTERRILCGNDIESYQHSILLDEPCPEPARLFPVIPDVTAQGLPPVTTRFSTSPRAQPFPECDIPCYHAGQAGIHGTRTIENTTWKLTFSMEGPMYYNSLYIQDGAFKNGQFWSTTSYQSDVPLPYYSYAEYKIQSPSVNYDKAIKGAVFLARNCHSRNGREGIVKKLMDSQLRVDSLSSCLHNAAPPPGVHLSNKKEVMSHYLFYLAFENQNIDDYITEKLWGPLEAGTVPVYMGAPNVKDHAPNRSVIVMDDFATTEELAEYLYKVANDKELYESYHKWRTEPLPPHFRARYDFTQVHSTCRTCRWAHARLYGLGWDHYNQSLRELHLPRKVCLDQHGLLKQPFVEEWYSGTNIMAVEAEGPESCTIDKAASLMESGNLRRTLVEQDGILDFMVEAIQSTTETFVLKLQTPLRSDTTFTLVQEGHGRIQNSKSRVTVLSSPKDGADISGHDNGIVSLSIDAQKLPLRIRFIVEDIDLVHLGAEKEENYFGDRMMQDFYNPVEGFVKTKR